MDDGLPIGRGTISQDDDARWSLHSGGAGWLNTVVVLAIAALLIIGVCAMGVSRFRDDLSLRAHGVALAADVEQVYLSGHKPSGWNIAYRYRVVRGASAGSTLRGHDSATPAQAAAARRTGIVPVAYDSTSPRRSALNFDGAVFKRPGAQLLDDPNWPLTIAMTIVAGLAAVILMRRGLPQRSTRLE
jgi:hypothetical protein